MSDDLSRRILEELSALPPGRARLVLEDALARLRASQRRGSPRALLQHAGTWSFEPGERDAIDREIDAMRALDMP